MSIAVVFQCLWPRSQEKNFFFFKKNYFFFIILFYVCLFYKKFILRFRLILFAGSHRKVNLFDTQSIKEKQNSRFKLIKKNFLSIFIALSSALFTSALIKCVIFYTNVHQKIIKVSVTVCFLLTQRIEPCIMLFSWF